MSRRGERLPAVLMFLLLLALPFLFQDPADGNEPPAETSRAERGRLQSRETTATAGRISRGSSPSLLK